MRSALFQGETRSEAFLSLNPTGAVPVLQLDDGRTIGESSAILIYLADGTRFLPADRYARAKVIQWLSFEQYYVEPAIGSLRFWTLTGRLDVNTGRMVASRLETAERALAALERSLTGGQFLVGNDLTLADIAVYAYTHRAEDCGFSFAALPAVSAWLDRVAAEIGSGFPVSPYTPDAMVTQAKS
jgi:glutathione S-transferase